MKLSSQNSSPCKPAVWKTLRSAEHGDLPELSRLFCAMQAERGQLAEVNIAKIHAAFEAGIARGSAISLQERARAEKFCALGAKASRRTPGRAAQWPVEQ